MLNRDFMVIMLKKTHEISFHPFSAEMESISPTLIEITVYNKCDR